MHQRLGRNQVAVPTHYFKVAVRRTSGDALDAIAFLIPNKKMSGGFQDYLVSIDEIEEAMGLDLLSALDDPAEDALEAAIARTLWR